jgi:hypothetical protein
VTGVAFTSMGDAYDPDERFSLHPMTFDEAAQALLKVAPMDEPKLPRGRVVGRYEADVEELQGLARKLSNDALAGTDEQWMTPEDIQKFLDDEGYRHDR